MGIKEVRKLAFDIAEKYKSLQFNKEKLAENIFKYVYTKKSLTVRLATRGYLSSKSERFQQR
jgi:hypothetical protein